MRVPAPAYEPDKAEIDASVGAVVRNVLPASNCYLPMPGVVALSGTTAIPDQPVGLFLAQASDGTFTMFAGTVDALYYYAGGTWTDCSKTGGYSDPDDFSGWNFAQYGDYVWAVSGANNPVQRIDLTDLPTGFDDVAGNGGSDDPPRAKFITVINEFIVLAGLTDYPTSVAWSGFADSLEWRLGVSGADRQEFPDGGLVSGLTGSEYGLVFQENSIRRMVFNPGDPLVFSFSRISERIGTSSTSAIVSSNGRTYALLEDGFYMEQGGQIQAIGKERVDRTFLADLAQGGRPYIVAAVDPISQRVFFAYPSVSQSDLTVRNKALVYDPNVDRWTTIEQDVKYLGSVAPPGVGLDTEPLASSNLDALPYSLDSNYWSGGRPVLGCFDTTNRLASFSGPSLEATIETGVVKTQAWWSGIKRVMPIVDTSNCSVNVATRATPFASDSWRTARLPSTISGYAHILADGRFHKLRATIPASTTWNKFQGWEVE